MSGHLAPLALWTAFPPSLAGRDSGDYYGASVTHRTRVPWAIPRSSQLHVTARRRRPTHLLKCPHWASLLAPEVANIPAAACRRAGTGFMRLSGGCELSSSGDWDSGNPAFAISRGSPTTPPQTPGRGLWFPDMLSSLFPSGSRSVIGPKNLPPSSSRLCRGCNQAPRGAVRALQLDPRPRGGTKPAAARKPSTTANPGRLPGHRVRTARPVDNESPHGWPIGHCAADCQRALMPN
jgi:hypothetical protein